jgi:hypothetical protein
VQPSLAFVRGSSARPSTRETAGTSVRARRDWDFVWDSRSGLARSREASRRCGSDEGPSLAASCLMMARPGLDRGHHDFQGVAVRRSWRRNHRRTPARRAGREGIGRVLAQRDPGSRGTGIGARSLAALVPARFAVFHKRISPYPRPSTSTRRSEWPARSWATLVVGARTKIHPVAVARGRSGR